jgi:hypothetical protein
MDNQLKQRFIDVVKSAAELPKALHDLSSQVTSVEEHQFDQTYIEFLDSQIQLEPRGPEWTHRLKRRKESLQPFCGMNLLRGGVKTSEAV